MTFTAVVLLILVILGSYWFLRRQRNNDQESKRSKQGRQLRSNASKEQATPKIKPNRYRRGRRGPSLGSNPLQYSRSTHTHYSVHHTAHSKESAENNVESKESQEPQVSKVPRSKRSQQDVTEVVAFNLLAPTEKPYCGYELLQALLAAGLRYGKMNIFHRHAERTGRGPVLFSLASVNKPGTFDLPRMGGFSTSGLSMFFVLGQCYDPEKAYAAMLETADLLVDDLGGKVYDDQLQLLTEEKVIQQQHRIKDFLSGRFTPDLFPE